MIDFTNIKFNPGFHTYTYEGKRLNNVTSIIKPLNPFDRDGKAAEIAKRKGIAVEDVLADWEAKGKASREHGTLIHEYVADMLLGVIRDNDPFLSLNSFLPEMEAFNQFWASMHKMAEVVKIEWVVGDIELKIAGTLDSLFLRDGMLHIFDWKTGKEFTTKSNFNKQCLPPFDDLDDCELIKYSFQTSLYRLCIERNRQDDLGGYPIGDSYIVYLSQSGVYHIYKAIDFRDRLLDWLTNDH